MMRIKHFQSINQSTLQMDFWGGRGEKHEIFFDLLLQVRRKGHGPSLLHPDLPELYIVGVPFSLVLY